MSDTTHLFIGLTILCMVAFVIGVSEGMGITSRIGIQIIKLVRGDPDAPSYEEIEKKLKVNLYWVYSGILSIHLIIAVICVEYFWDLPVSLFLVLMGLAAGIVLCGINSYLHKRDYRKILAFTKSQHDGGSQEKH